MGLMIGVEFNNPIAREVVNKLIDKHYLVGAVGDSILRIVPPLIITKQDADEFTDALLQCMD